MRFLETEIKKNECWFKKYIYKKVTLIGNMKNIFIFFAILFSINNSSNAQCISGDCENGVGSFNTTTGVYSGQFKKSLPNGEGLFIGLNKWYKYIDSIKDEGIFIDGVFFSGKRTLLKTWESTGINEKHLWVKFFEGDNYKNTSQAEKKSNFPVENFVDEIINGKEKKITIYEYSNPEIGHRTWRGKLKKGLPDGEGRLYLGRDHNHVLNLTYEKGLVKGAVKVEAWYTYIGDKINPFRLVDFDVTNNFIDSLVYNTDGDTIIRFCNRDFLNALQTDYSGSISGACIKLNNNGSVYKGELVNGLYNGYGELRHGDGTLFKGFYFQNLKHGPGVIISASGEKDSGIYLFSKLAKGVIYRNGKQPQNFPICLSGNCMNGFGKASFKTITNDTLLDIYEGNFVNGFVSGNGKRNFVNGTTKYEKKGNFSAGYLNGEGTINCNVGIIRKFNGRFENDTLAVGTMHYNDGSSFEFDATSYLHSPYRAMPAVVFGILNKKILGGDGTYRSSNGTIITGEFNLNDNSLMRGKYMNVNGIVINNFGRDNDVYANYRLPYSYNIDGIDSYVSAIINQIKWDDNERIKGAKAMAEKRERDAKFSENFENASNFIDVSNYVSCCACNGMGAFVYSNTFGGNYTIEEDNGKGGYKKVTYERIGRTYTNKVKCGACNGNGGMTVSSKKYIGPVY